jgi:dTDP-glucose 4,6-dehydratase
MHLVTGGAGFIGSALVHALVRRSVPVVNVDKLTYAANPASLADVANEPHYRFEHVDICDALALRGVFQRYAPRVVLHLAAESHVDRSIDAPADFVRTNVVGTFTLLSEARRYWTSLPADEAARFRFILVSTDEVFGSLRADDAPFDEHSRYDPSSPYAASKAGADHLAQAWHRTYRLPLITTYASNNFGPRQFPEKLVPLTIINAIEERPIDVYGHGGQRRDWLHVEDHVDALLAIADRGRVGERYAIAGMNERRNIDVVNAVCDLVDAAVPRSTGAPRRSLVRFVEDRPGHDYRYALDPATLRAQLGWQPRRPFDSALAETVQWYLDNRAWWEPLRERAAGRRQGLEGRE